jgi:hypothetical protein
MSGQRHGKYIKQVDYLKWNKKIDIKIKNSVNFYLSSNLQKFRIYIYI